MSCVAGKPIPELTDRQLRNFWAKVTLPDETGCMNWTGSRKGNGYGEVSLKPAGKFLVHRVAYTIANGPIPPGLVIDHLCRNPQCVNPEHLEAVTNRENTLRGAAMQNGAHNAAKTHCPQGHEYAGENLYVHNGHRSCVECKRERVRAYRRRKGLTNG